MSDILEVTAAFLGVAVAVGSIAYGFGWLTKFLRTFADD